MAVAFYNFHDLHNHDFKEKVFQRFSEIYDNNGFVEGEYNHSFEQRFSKLQQAKHALLVANGTDALEIALEVYNIGPGDKVGVPGITFYATAEAVLNRGALPVYIDIDPQTGLICPESAERVVKSSGLKAIMPVHIYGLPANIAALETFCRPKEVAIIEDAAQAQGAYYHDKRPVGSSDNLTTFSFYPTKNLSAFGDAGAILTQDDLLAKKIMTIRNHGRSELEMLGRNSRCDHMQAAVLDLKLDDVDHFNNARKKVAKTYHHQIREADLAIHILDDQYLELSSWHLYPIVLKDVAQRVALQEHLKKDEIGHTPFYEQAMHQMKVLKKFKEGETQRAEDFAGRVICLPMNPFLKEADISEVVTSLKNFFSSSV